MLPVVAVPGARLRGPLVAVAALAVSGAIAGWSVGGQYLVDIVSAASVDIVSTASRHWKEVRHAGALDAAYEPGTLGVRASGTFLPILPSECRSGTNSARRMAEGPCRA